MQQLDLLFLNKAVFLWSPRYGHSLHCAKVSSSLRSSCVTKFNVTPYSIGSKTQQNSPCPGKQVKEHIRSVPPFDMVCLELFSGFRVEEINGHTPHVSTHWPHSDCYSPREQCLLPAPQSVISQADQSQLWSVVGWKNSRQNSSGCHKSSLWFVGNPGLSVSKEISALEWYKESY